MRTLAIIGTLVMLGGSAAAAPEQADSADTIIDRGIDLRRQGKPAEALELFERASTLAPSARAVAQMGLAEISLHRWIDAETHLSEALARHDSEWIENAKTRETLEKSLADVRLHVGRVRIQGTEGAEITVDGKVVGRLPLPSPVHINPGTIRIHVSASGRQPADVDVVVAAGQEVVATTELDPNPITLVPAGPPPVPLTPALGAEDRRSRTWAETGLIAAGGVTIITGVVWLAIDGKGTCDPAPRGTCQHLYDTSLQGWIAIGAGAVLAGTGTGLLLRSGHEQRVSLTFGPTSLFAIGRF
jgi:hypothetical protein